jgi:hypothetical protein
MLFILVSYTLTTCLGIITGALLVFQLYITLKNITTIEMHYENIET